MAPAYRFGKGPIVTALEEFVAGATIGETNDWLDELRKQAQQPDEKNTLFDTYLQANRTPDDYDHLLHDVFGYDRPGKQPLPVDEKSEGQSRRKVYADGFARAVEAVYGIQHGADVPGDRATTKPHLALDVYWGCVQPNNSVIVNVSGDQVVVHVFSTAVPPGFDQDEQAKYLPKNASVVDDRLGLGDVNPWKATADAPR